MTHDKQTRINTGREQYEPILRYRMVWIRYKPTELVRKSSLGLKERDVMLLTILGILAGIPFEAKTIWCRQASGRCRATI